MPEQHESGTQRAAGKRPRFSGAAKTTGPARTGLIQKAAQPRLLGLAALMLAAAVSITFLSGLASVEADNENISEGTPVECADSSIFDGRAESNVATAPAGFVISRICIEADSHPDASFSLGGTGDCANVDDSGRDGDGSLHSPCIASSGPIDCFSVADIGTQTVTVTSANVNCTVAHIDYETQAVGGAPSLDKSHNAIWDVVDVGDRVEWVLLVTNTNGLVVDIDDKLPPAFVLDTAFSWNDAGITCTTNLDTETVECDGTSSVDTLEIRIRGVAVSCSSDSANTASGTVGGAPVSDIDAAISVENCPAPAPSVNLTVYEDFCPTGPGPFPPFVEALSLAEGGEYCLVPSAGDYVIDDTWRLTASDIGSPSFDLIGCFTNSAGVDPCESLAPGGSPFVMELVPPQDPDSFVAGEVNFTFVSCEDSSVSLTLTYDGPSFGTASDTVTLPCVGPQAPADPGLMKSHAAGDDEIGPGETHEWILTVSNATGLPIDIDDVLPAGFQLLSVASDDGGVSCTANTETDTASCEGTATQETVTITLQASAPEEGCGQITNTASGSIGSVAVSDSDIVEVVGCDEDVPDDDVPGEDPTDDGRTIIRTLDLDLDLDLEMEVENSLDNVNQNINDNANANENKNANDNSQDQSNDQATNVSTGDVNVTSSGGSGTGTGSGNAD